MNSSKPAFPYKTLQVSAGGGPVARSRALIFNPEGKVLLARLPHSDFWSLPGGKVDALESTETAMFRELMEEFDLVPTALRLRFIVEIPFINGIEFYYVGKTDKSTLEELGKGVESGEVAEIGFFAWGEKPFKPASVAEFTIEYIMEEGVQYLGTFDH